MTIRDSARRVLAGGAAVLAAAAVVVSGLAACGQRGPLRLPTAATAAAAAAPVGVERGYSAASAVDARDPFSNPSPSTAPAPVPRP